ncbi:zinc ABC transporter substrate-binding protein [Loktanella sp. Alg231-35]|uniref:zinc ABC transporter substrate-binding protein n=1 Tax=Loktanella sp. Alg231-35 TaxID=1922220 RepID=UPI000D55E321|nr:zinc ABC transporter substrate-binding protein [Loktanella sp. Alg231-35]
MIRYIAPFALLPLTANAEAPKVITDIAPIHSLTAQVMGDLGTPDLLLPPGADPHDFALRPSDADRLGNAALVIWVGHGLTPWLEEPLEILAPSAIQLELLETDGWETLEIRDLKEIGANDDHEHDEDGHDDHDHDDHDHDEDEHDDHEHDEDGHDEDGHEEEHEEHGHDDDHDAHDEDDDHDAHGHDAHDHGDFDPHAWGDPEIAQVWLGHIATALSEADPDNAATYQANAEAAQASIATLDATLTARLAPLAGQNYILPHDGYQYFEARYGLTAVGALADVDGRTPGPAQVSALRDQMAAEGIICVFSDRAIGDRWAAILTEGNDANTATLDAIGVGLTAGPALYTDLMERLGGSFEDCLTK